MKNQFRDAYRVARSFSRRGEQEEGLVAVALWHGVNTLGTAYEWIRYGEGVKLADSLSILSRRRWNCGEWKVCRPAGGDSLGFSFRLRVVQNIYGSNAVEELGYSSSEDDMILLEQVVNYLNWGGRLPR